MSSSPTDASIVAVSMPQMGISVAEGTILEWRKRPGDWVEADETICDVSTDKVDVEIPSPASGRLERILVEPGETVSVGTPLAEVDTAAAPGEAHPEESPEAHRAEPPEVDRSRFYSPVVRRVAEEHGIDLEQVEGTGVGGRVRKVDLMHFLENGAAKKERGEPEVREERPLHTESPYQGEPQPAASAEDLIGPTRRERMSPMREQIARHMLDSRRNSAHCTTIVEVDFSRVADQRQDLRETMARRGVNLTYLAFVAREAVAALERHPVLNASLDGEEIVYHDQVNLGIAVALENGLIVPVIRQAERLSLEGLAAAIGDLATRAREKRLHPDEVQGGTFTITNPGQFGAVLATPIINQPQVAILDLEAIVKRAVVVERDGDEAIAIRPMSYLCMSWDHRALDGAEAARFLAEMRTGLEEGGSA
ncbi:MAG TPA: dihydrolipoamide acetyltransferase family protein [Solirubrobacterales bacterium]|nr:dihydrolipoamide acetyltransferase family protein [Solirubrobacterales bacterium]